MTVMPLSWSSLAVPPVDRISTPASARSRANSTTPVLSETLIRALVMLGMILPAKTGAAAYGRSVARGFSGIAWSYSIS
jgi:hypothetical protein